MDLPEKWLPLIEMHMNEMQRFLLYENFACGLL